jgi:hypothetical protein
VDWPAAKREAVRRRREIAPVLQVYSDVGYMLWPYVTIAQPPNLAMPVMTTDSRGYRFSRLGEAAVASDRAPDDAGFVLGGSAVLGAGASDDWGTLPSALWRRSGKPYVNLGVSAGTSTQELITALPFADRTTTFIVYSGLNNLNVARADPLDPLFGASHLDYWLRRLQKVQLEELVDMVKAVRNGRVPRFRTARRPPWGKRKPAKPEKDLDKSVRTAAAIQLRDLRTLRRVVADDAEVVFALQPVAAQADKELSEEEVALFEAHDVIFARSQTWAVNEELMSTYWGAYAAELAGGCATLGVPFVNLSDATYTEWCFVDRVHMTDRGYDIAAAFLLEALA